MLSFLDMEIYTLFFIGFVGLFGVASFAGAGIFEFSDFFRDDPSMLKHLISGVLGVCGAAFAYVCKEMLYVSNCRIQLEELFYLVNGEPQDDEKTITLAPGDVFTDLLFFNRTLFVEWNAQRALLKADLSLEYEVVEK